MLPPHLLTEQRSGDRHLCLMSQAGNEGIFSWHLSFHFRLCFNPWVRSWLALALPGNVSGLGLKWEAGRECLLTQVTVSLRSLGQAASSCDGSRVSRQGRLLGQCLGLLCMSRPSKVTAQGLGEKGSPRKVLFPPPSALESTGVSTLLGPPS